MTREQAYYAFLSRLADSWAVYDESTVPDDASIPRITYNVSVAEFGDPVPMSLSLWDRATKWTSVTYKAEEIYRAIGYGGTVLKYDDGYIWIKRGQPFYQRMADSDDSIRRIYINLEVEYLTAI